MINTKLILNSGILQQKYDQTINNGDLIISNGDLTNKNGAVLGSNGM